MVCPVCSWYIIASWGGKPEYVQNRKLRARLILLGGTRDQRCGGRETLLRRDVRLDRGRCPHAGRRVHALSSRRQRCGRRLHLSSGRAGPLGSVFLDGLRRRIGGRDRARSEERRGGK